MTSSPPDRQLAEISERVAARARLGKPTQNWRYEQAADDVEFLLGELASAHHVACLEVATAIEAEAGPQPVNSVEMGEFEYVRGFREGRYQGMLNASLVARSSALPVSDVAERAEHLAIYSARAAEPKYPRRPRWNGMGMEPGP